MFQFLSHVLLSVLILSKQENLCEEEQQPPAIIYEHHSCFTEFPGYGGKKTFISAHDVAEMNINVFSHPFESSSSQWR